MVGVKKEREETSGEEEEGGGERERGSESLFLSLSPAFTNRRPRLEPPLEGAQLSVQMWSTSQSGPFACSQGKAQHSTAAPHLTGRILWAQILVDPFAAAQD